MVDDLSPRDFDALRASLAKTRNPNTLGNEVTRIRVAFKYAYDADLIEHPIKFGPTFKRPAKRILRAVRQRKDKKLFSAKEIRDILEIASKPMKAMKVCSSQFTNKQIVKYCNCDDTLCSLAS